MLLIGRLSLRGVERPVTVLFFVLLDDFSFLSFVLLSVFEVRHIELVLSLLYVSSSSCVYPNGLF